MSLTSVLLPEPLTPVTATNSPSGIRTSMSLQVVGPRALDRPSRPCPACAACRGASMALRAAQVRAGQRVVAGSASAAGVPWNITWPPCSPAPGPEVDDVVGHPDRLLVVLDDDDGVAEIAQPGERGEQPAVVALVQADRRLVEHVEHAGEVRADLRGQPDALPFPARERRGAARQREIADADLVEEAQALADLLEDAAGDQPSRARSGHRLEDLQRSLTGRVT